MLYTQKYTPPHCFFCNFVKAAGQIFEQSLILTQGYEQQPSFFLRLENFGINGLYKRLKLRFLISLVYNIIWSVYEMPTDLKKTGSSVTILCQRELSLELIFVNKSAMLCPKIYSKQVIHIFNSIKLLCIFTKLYAYLYAQNSRMRIKFSIKWYTKLCNQLESIASNCKSKLEFTSVKGRLF